MREHLFTSESVTEGHPDKLSDQISDGILDAILAEDHNARVACETLVTTGQVVVAGEVSTTARVDIPEIVRATIAKVGYTSSEIGFDAATCAILVALDRQSPDIAQGVDTAHEARVGTSADPYDLQGAGDQGLMFGYASDETPQLMPVPITLAHRISERLAASRHSGRIPYLRPDGKTQVTVRYQDGQPVGVAAVVLSTQHNPDIDRGELELDMINEVIRPVLEEYGYWNGRIRHFINPTGKFVVGGPMGDAGLTGRKIIVDTYGGMARHGGGAFSGKDPSKVDRSAAYAARWVAKNVVAAGLAARCEVQVAYAIGVARPVSVLVETFDTETRPVEQIERWIVENFDLRPAAIVERLDLRRPIYQQTAAYGHFGRELPGFTWESTAIGNEARG